MPQPVGDDDVRRAFAAASARFVDLAVRLTPEQLAGPGTDEWTVRELLAHTARAFLATETVVAADVDEASRWLDGPAAYYRAAFDVAGVHAGIAGRARAAADAMGDDPAGFVRASDARVAALVAATPDDRVVQHFAGRLRFGDYLVTRVTELVLHTVDLQLAVGAPPAADAVAARTVAALLVELSDRADPLALACVLAGRPWPGGVDVLR